MKKRFQMVLAVLLVFIISFGCSNYAAKAEEKEYKSESHYYEVNVKSHFNYEGKEIGVQKYFFICEDENVVWQTMNSPEYTLKSATINGEKQKELKNEYGIDDFKAYGKAFTWEDYNGDESISYTGKINFEFYYDLESLPKSVYVRVINYYADENGNTKTVYKGMEATDDKYKVKGTAKYKNKTYSLELVYLNGIAQQTTKSSYTLKKADGDAVLQFYYSRSNAVAESKLKKDKTEYVSVIVKGYRGERLIHQTKYFETEKKFKIYSEAANYGDVAKVYINGKKQSKPKGTYDWTLAKGNVEINFYYADSE